MYTKGTHNENMTWSQKKMKTMTLGMGKPIIVIVQ